jgi:hypothetical protein
LKRRIVPGEVIADLRLRLERLNARSHERVELIKSTADLYGVSVSSVYRALSEKTGPRRTRRSDHGRSRKLATTELHQYCEVIAALKSMRNKKGRHMGTSFAIHLLETSGIDTPNGRVKAPPGMLSKSLVNRYMKQLGLQADDLLIEPPSQSFQAERSNQCWQFDISHSDLKELPEIPPWIDLSRGRPKLMLFSVTDDRSGVCYQDYCVVFGEELEAVLRFLYRAMAPKDNYPFQGIPEMIYCDNGSFRRSAVFNRVLKCLDIELKSHMPEGSDGRRTPARSKGKVERAFRTIKETHEVLFHKLKPQNEEEANQGLHHHLYTYYNTRDHRSEKRTRIEDWLQSLPPRGYKQMCSWEKFSAFARTPVDRTISKDSKVSWDGAEYKVDPELLGLDVTVLLGILDNEIYVEHNNVRYGPYKPDGGPIPLHTYKKFAKTKREKLADRIEELSKAIKIPKSAMTGVEEAIPSALIAHDNVPSIPFPEDVEEQNFPDASQARLGISRYLGRDIPDLPVESVAFISELVASTLNKREVLSKVKAYFSKPQRKADLRAK